MHTYISPFTTSSSSFNPINNLIFLHLTTFYMIFTISICQLLSNSSVEFQCPLKFQHLHSFILFALHITFISYVMHPKIFPFPSSIALHNSAMISKWKWFSTLSSSLNSLKGLWNNLLSNCSTFTFLLCLFAAFFFLFTFLLIFFCDIMQFHFWYWVFDYVAIWKKCTEVIISFWIASQERKANFEFKFFHWNFFSNYNPSLKMLFEHRSGTEFQKEE